jgi:hypothetical protein
MKEHYKISNMQYIFTSPEGITIAPNGEEVFNFQVMGIAFGRDEAEALEQLLLDNVWIEKSDFDIERIKAHPLSVTHNVLM